MTRHPDWPRRWRVWRDQGDWFVISPEYAERSFRTWREAQDYADRMARTREYVLPRVAPQGEISVSATWYYDQGAIHYINSAGQVVQGAPADVKPLALALLALAEQEKP